VRVAFLGPKGTNSDLACQQFLPAAEAVPCFSISEVFKAIIEQRVDAGLLPIENMIQGPVTETLDLLFEHSGSIYIADSGLMRIQNAFGVLPGGDWPRAIKTVHSHEQPLRQCSRYLADNFPDAELLTSPSTAAAISAVKEGGMQDAAVLAAPAALAAAQFQVVSADVSDVPLNKTRFVLARRGKSEEHLRPEAALLQNADSGTGSYATSIVVDPGRDRKGLLFELLNVISIVHRVNILTIHSRPDTRGGVVFYFDLEGHPGNESVRGCLEELRRFCSDSTSKTTEIHILGVYPRSPFYVMPFKNVGIIGSAGVMGQWFRKFFQSAGVEVLECDRGSGLPLKELAKKSDVLLLSVPMSAAAEVVEELLPHVRPGHLIVENCSIKSCALPTLLARAPEKAEVLGIHTMFAGDVASIQDQNVVVTRTTRSGEKAQAFEDVLYKHGARIQYISIDDHDRVAALVQSLIQFNMLALADVMQSTFPSLDALNVLSTPNFRNILAVASRVLGQSDDLIFDLQLRNENASELRKRFRESVERIATALDRGDNKVLLDSLAASRTFIKPS